MAETKSRLAVALTITVLANCTCEVILPLRNGQNANIKAYGTFDVDRIIDGYEFRLPQAFDYNLRSKSDCTNCANEIYEGFNVSATTDVYTIFVENIKTVSVDMPYSNITIDVFHPSVVCSRKNGESTLTITSTGGVLAALASSVLFFGNTFTYGLHNESKYKLKVYPKSKTFREYGDSDRFQIVSPGSTEVWRRAQHPSDEILIDENNINATADGTFISSTPLANTVTDPHGNQAIWLTSNREFGVRCDGHIIKFAQMFGDVWNVMMMRESDEFVVEIFKDGVVFTTPRQTQER